MGPLPPESGGVLRGGVTRFHATLLEEWQGNESHGVEIAGVMIPPPHRMAPGGRKLSTLRIYGPAGVNFVRLYRRVLARARPDVVAIQHVPSFAGSRCALAHSRLAPEVPVVGVVHAWHPITQRTPKQGQRNYERTQRALEALPLVVFGSDHCRREGLELGFRYPAETEVVPYCLPQFLLDPGAGDPEQPREGVLFLASLTARKNPGALLRAVAERPELKLVLAGRGPEEPALRKMVAESGIADRVRFLPHLGIEEHTNRIREELFGASLLCLPSRSESFGLVQIEALAAGTPVVGFGPTFEEISREMGMDCGEPLHEQSFEEIGTAIDRVLARDWDRAALRKRAIEVFSPTRSAAGYARLLHRLVPRASLEAVPKRRRRRRRRSRFAARLFPIMSPPRRSDPPAGGMGRIRNQA